MIEAVIFDLGRVYLPFNRRPMEEAAAKYLDINPAVVHLETREVLGALLEGKMRLLDLYSMITHNLAGNKKAELALQAHLKVYNKTSAKPYPEMVNLVRALREQVTVACFSNLELESAQALQAAGVLDNFDRSFLSCEMHIKKPSLEAYKQVRQYLKLEGNQILFFDDDDSYWQGALRDGWKAEKFTTYKDCIETLSHQDKFLHSSTTNT